MGVKIRNRQECGYRSLVSSVGKVYAYNNFFKLHELEIEHVQIIQNRTKDYRRDLVAATNRISQTILFGIIGNILSAPKGIEFDMELDIYTADTVFEIWTNERRLIKALVPYMHVKDPREKFRKMRGVK